MQKLAYELGVLLALQGYEKTASALPPAVSDLLLRSGIGGTLWGGYDAAIHPEDRFGEGLRGAVKGVSAGAATSLARSGLRKMMGPAGKNTLGQKLVAGFGQGAAGIAGGVGGEQLMNATLGSGASTQQSAGRHVADASY